ncbi:hypothetical protein RRG08_031542 [Elysia crispata]|uniref:Uncharacterized protein n=1 Tax=Elysia crispata TaxID=231223 RepID=A0AAE0Z517_9GAST|nr:hypothetical protein RRG08_031542 [Elysia crispata]
MWWGTGLPCVADSSAAAHLMLDTRNTGLAKQSYTELYTGRTREEGRERDGRTEITEWIAKVWSDNLWRAEDREKWRELAVTCCDVRTVVRPRLNILGILRHAWLSNIVAVFNCDIRGGRFRNSVWLLGFLLAQL